MEKPLFEEISSLETTARHLQSQITHLKIQDFDKRTEYLKRKNELIERRNNLLAEANELRKKLLSQEQKQYSEKLQQLLTENRNLILFEVNGYKINIPQDLTIEIEFYPCKHKKAMPLQEVMRAFTFQGMQRTPESNHRLFTRWDRMFKDNATLTGRLNCPKCEKTITKILHGKEKSKGRANWILRKLQ